MESLYLCVLRFVYAKIKKKCTKSMYNVTLSHFIAVEPFFFVSFWRRFLVIHAIKVCKFHCFWMWCDNEVTTNVTLHIRQLEIQFDSFENEMNTKYSDIMNVRQSHSVGVCVSLCFFFYIFSNWAVYLCGRREIQIW